MKVSILIWLAILINTNLITFIYTYNYTRRDTFDKIISEECWFNQQTRDIECITYIGE